MEGFSEKKREMKEGGGERGSEDFTESGCSSESSTCFGSNEEHTSSEESLSSGWPIGENEGKTCPLDVGVSEKGGTHQEKINDKIPEMEMMKERFSKLLLGEDMSGGGKGVCTALAISNAITNLSATIFGQIWRLEPLPPEKKSMWRREMECLTCASDHIVELVPSWQILPGGTKLEVMTSRPRSDIYINLPALRKLDNMLLEILDSFSKNEFCYVDQGVVAPDADKAGSLQGTGRRQEEKWWLPVPRVPPCGLHEKSMKLLQHKSECASQILKAAVAINNNALKEMEVPESYLESLPRNARSCLGDVIYRYITSDRFSSDCLLDCLDLSSEHQALQYANRFEASTYVLRKRSNIKHAMTAERSNAKSSWEIVKDLMSDADQRELFAERAESLLLCLKQRFPGLSQTCLDMSKIQYNKDVGLSILESYSRVLESLAFNIIARIDDLLHVDDQTRHADDFASLPTVSIVAHSRRASLPFSMPASPSPYPMPSSTPSFSPLLVVNHRRGANSSVSCKSPSHGFGAKKALTQYLGFDAKAMGASVSGRSENMAIRKEAVGPTAGG